MPNLDGQVAIVTGASRGIGRGSALELAKCGADVTVNYRTHPEEAEETAQLIRSRGRRAVVVRADVSDREQVQAMVDETLSVLGQLDILVANAANSVRKPFLELEVGDVQATWGPSLWGVFHCCQLAARQIVKQGRGGKMCVISSVHASMPFKTSLAYNTAKAGINQMAMTIANELAEHRINVNVIEPGWTDTPGERRYYSEEDMKEAAKKIPLGRMATIEDVGKAVAFLCSDDADYITGDVLCLDGGFSFPDWRMPHT